MGRDIIGQEAMVERILIGLLANAQLRVESLPGLAKTRAIKSLGRHMHANPRAAHARIQAARAKDLLLGVGDEIGHASSTNRV